MRRSLRRDSFSSFAKRRPWAANASSGERAGGISPSKCSTRGEGSLPPLGARGGEEWPCSR